MKELTKIYAKNALRQCADSLKEDISHAEKLAASPDQSMNSRTYFKVHADELRSTRDELLKAAFDV